MTANEFVDLYNKSELKEEFLINSIKIQYVKYSEKITDCKRIIKASTEVDGIFNINSPAQFMLFAVTLITKYTDIELEENMLNLFETLDEANLINGIMGVIPERELASYNTILQMCLDDYMETNRSLVGFIETKVAALQISTDSLLEALQGLIPQNEEEKE